MSRRLAGKVVLITGGASGIGLAGAEACAREGASVVITDINAAEGAAQPRGRAGHEATRRIDHQPVVDRGSHR